MQPLLRAGFHPGADPAGAGDRHAQSGAEPRRFRGGSRRRGAEGRAGKRQQPLVSRAAAGGYPAEEELKKLAQLLRYSSNIALMCGSGCAGAHKELLEFAGN
jgi:hypothetical protein